jgi:prolyl-tRNA synthetase
MLEVYRDLAENWLAMPVMTGQKTDNERFRGAVRTYCIEAMMRDGKALQAGTSHFLGQNFSQAFGIQFQSQDPDEGLQFAWQTRWGVSTRLIGAVVLGHGDAKGLLLPPKLAPIQVVIVPIYKSDEEKEEVLACCQRLRDEFAGRIRVHLDDRDTHTPGFKFNYWEQKGVPIRLNIGPKDVAGNVVEVARRDLLESKEKNYGKLRGISQEGLTDALVRLLDEVQKNMFARALRFRQENTHKIDDYKAFARVLDNESGFIEAPWCGDGDCELAIKEDTKATIRVIPFAQEPRPGKCVRCGHETNKRVIFARAY